jgi:membrane protein
MRGTLARQQKRLMEWVYTLPAPPIIRTLIEMIYRVFRDFSRDDGSHMAAGVAYYAIFSLFPLALGTISIAGLFVSADDVRDNVLSFLQDQIGVGSEALVTSNIEALLNARGAVGVAAMVTLFWSSRAVFGAVHRVMNRAWKVTEPPHFVSYQLAQIGAAFGVAVLFIASATVGPAGRALASRTEYLFGLQMPWATLFTVLPLLLSALMLVLIFRVVPDAKVRWRDAVPAAVVATVLFELAKAGFTYYLSNLSSLDLVYGSVTTIVVLMLFLYLVAMVLVLGAELSSEYNRSSRSGLLIFRGHWKPVRGGFATLAHRELDAANSGRSHRSEARRTGPMPSEREIMEQVAELDLPAKPGKRDRPPGI